MKIEELIRKIDFHDSSVIELLHENDIVQLKIDLCMWRQEGYQESDNAIKEIVLVFDAVTDYIWDSDKAEDQIDYDTILRISYEKGILEIVLLDEVVSVIRFKGSTVNFM